MSRAYIPPHLRSKPQKNFTTQSSHGRYAPQRNKLGEDLKVQSKKIPFNNRFNGMFSSLEKTAPVPIKKRVVKGLDKERCGCIVLYSRRHDSIFLMGSEENTICIKMHPKTQERKKLANLPYFRDRRDSRDVLTPKTAWFDENEDFIFILNETSLTSYQIIKYDILKNMFPYKDRYTVKMGKEMYFSQVTSCTYRTNNKYHLQLLVTANHDELIPDKTKFTDWLTQYDVTSSKINISNVTPQQTEINKSYYQISGAYSKRTKKMYLFGMDLCNDEEFGVLTRKMRLNESDCSQWEPQTSPEAEYFKKFRYYGFCMVNERYCIFVGGKRQEVSYSGPVSILHKDIYFYDVVLDTWEKSPMMLEEPLCKIGCVYDDTRRALHFIGGKEQENYGSYNVYNNVKFYRKISIICVIPGFRDLELVKSILKYWFEKSEERIFGRWNCDITKVIYSYN